MPSTLFGRNSVGKHLHGDAPLKLHLVARVRRTLQRCRLAVVCRSLEVERGFCAVVVAGLTEVRQWGTGTGYELYQPIPGVFVYATKPVGVKLRLSLLQLMCLLLEQTILLMDRRILLLQFHEYLLNLDHPLEKRHLDLQGPAGLGRWPANVMHDGSDEVVALFPREAGAAAPVTVRNADKFRGTYGAFAGNIDEAGSTFHADTGSVARFFYCAKADRTDRNEGCEQFAAKPLNWSSGTQSPGTFQADGTDRTSANNHPTVKPTALMRHLCKLVTPVGGLILDPFMGSGSTGRGAVLEGFRFIGIEREAEYVEIARARIASARRQGHQPTLELAT